MVVNLESDRQGAVTQTVTLAGASVSLTTPTSLSRLAWTCRGLSDITKSRVVSTEGAVPSDSGAYWTFLSISFTELLSHNTAGGQQRKAWRRRSSLPDWTRSRCELNSPFVDFGVLALGTERTDLKLHCALLQKERRRKEISSRTHASVHRSHSLCGHCLTLPTSCGAG